MKAPTTQGPVRGQRQSGAIAIMFGLTVALLIGFAGLAIDLGRFFVVKSEYQNAVDACALAAASQLRPGQNNPNALTRAVAYGRVFSTGGVDDPATAPLEGNILAIKNMANFQGTVVDIAADQIRFSNTLGGPYETSASANFNTAAFARCTYSRDDLPIFFMKVLNAALTTQTVSATAAATLAPSSSSCAIPVGVCKSPGSTAASNFGLTLGRWMSEPADGKGYGTGNFGWIDFTPPAGGVGNELRDLLQGNGQCEAKIGDKVGEQGNKTSLDQAWNTRFGLYKKDGATQVTDHPPDRTGRSYTLATWPAGSNAFAGVAADPASYPNYGGASADFLPYKPPPVPGAYKYLLTKEEHKQFGRLDRRVTVAPIVDCSVWGVKGSGSKQPALEGWACVLMLNPVLDKADTHTLEFLGLSTVAGSVCATNGEPGTFGPLVPQLVQ